MHINLILSLFVILLGVSLGVNDTQKSRKWYIILCSAVLVFVAAMRSPEWMTNEYGIDTIVYRYNFEISFDMGWDELWAAAAERYVGLNDDSDIGFLVLLKIIGFFTHDFYVYSLISDLLFFIPFGVLLYRYTTSMKQLIFAYIYYIALVQIYFFGGARQIFAMGFDLMALLAVMDKKKVLTIILFLIGVSIHFSSFLFAIPLLMIWFNASPKTLKSLHVVCFILFPLVFMMPNQIIRFMGEASGLEKYANYAKKVIHGGANTFIFLIEMLSLFCMIAIKKKDMEQSKKFLNFYVMVPLFTFFAPLVRSNGTMIRIALYYSIYLSVLVPYSIDCMFKNNEKTLAYVVAIGALAYLTIANGGMIYYFYWQF